jgi:hypothetical protein
MNYFVFTLMAALLLMGSPSRAQGCADSLMRSIPAGIISGLPGWSVVTVRDLPNDDKKLWATAHGDRCPGIAVGNFTGDRKPSYAVAFIRKAPSGQLFEQLVLFAAYGPGRYRVVAVRPTEVVSPFVVWVAPPGTYSGVEQGGNIKIANDSFVYEKLEAFATQYYLDRGRLRSLVSSN